MTGGQYTSLRFHGSTEPYEARFTIVSPVTIVCSLLLGYAGLLVATIVAGLRREPFPADPLPSDFVFYSMFVGLLGGVAVWFVVMAVSWLLACLRREVALRLDRQGVTLGRQPFPPRPTLTVPWRDLDAIVLLRLQRSVQAVPVPTRLVALRLKDGIDPPPGVPRRGSLRARLYWFPVSPAVADVHLTIRGWRLDLDELEAARRAFGPSVTIVDGAGS